jgi:class 3 adenylate cyclase
MVFWGPPFTTEADQATFACRATLEQFDKLAKLQRMLPDIMGFRKGLPRVNIRVGLSTGPLIADSMGSHLSKTYTVMDDTVNIAARLEAANKQYDMRVLMSQETYAMVRDSFAAREIDDIIVGLASG